MCDGWCEVIAAAGYTPGVYASTSWFNNKIGTIVEPHTKWVAQYYKECQYKGTYDIWQYSSSEGVPGISSRTDVNWAYKNLGKEPLPAQPVEQNSGKPYGGTFPKLPARKIVVGPSEPPIIFNPIITKIHLIVLNIRLNHVWLLTSSQTILF